MLLRTRQNIMTIKVEKDVLYQYGRRLPTAETECAERKGIFAILAVRKSSRK